ncbi:MAG TPA: nuclear transport factor 2 family protein, partial [Kofleriaceae bacterium]|nr:nuclear transport factor 2 family protein [Kofleriaceae bacterium]
LLTSWPVKEQQVSDHGLAFALAKPCSSETLLSFIANFLGLPKLTEAQERAIREYFLHLDARDYRALSDLCTEDVIYRLPSTGETVCGRGAFRAHAERTFTPLSSATFTLREIRPLPTGALAHYTGRWTEGDGQRSLDGVVAFRFANELICEIGVRIDLARARPVH